MRPLLPLQAPALLALLLCAPGSHALELRPTTLELAPGQVQAELWLINDELTAWEGRLRVYAWDQNSGLDRLQPTTALVTSPTYAHLPPGARQKIRLVTTPALPGSGATEQAFRILIESSSPGTTRYSLPLFISPARMAAGALSARLSRDGDTPCLALHNAGTRRARLQDLVQLDPDGRRGTLLTGLAGYVLAGATVCWQLPAPFAEHPGVRFLVRRNGGTADDLTPIAAAAGAGL